MRLAALSRLVRLSLAREREARSSPPSAWPVRGRLVFFVGLGLGVGRVIRERIFPTDARLVDVVPPAVSLGSLLGGGKLDNETVERLAALPGVEKVYRKMNVRVPAGQPLRGRLLRLPAAHGHGGAGRVDRAGGQDVQLGEFKDPGRTSPSPPSSPRGCWRSTTRPSPRPASCRRSRRRCSSASASRWSSTAYAAQAAPGPTTPAQAQVVGLGSGPARRHHHPARHGHPPQPRLGVDARRSPA